MTWNRMEKRFVFWRACLAWLSSIAARGYMLCHCDVVIRPLGISPRKARMVSLIKGYIHRIWTLHICGEFHQRWSQVESNNQTTQTAWFQAGCITEDSEMFWVSFVWVRWQVRRGGGLEDIQPLFFRCEVRGRRINPALQRVGRCGFGAGQIGLEYYYWVAPGSRKVAELSARFQVSVSRGLDEGGAKSPP